MNWNVLRNRAGDETFHAVSDDRKTRYLITRQGEKFALLRITGRSKTWNAEPIGTTLFLDTAKETCDERERREVAARAAAKSGRVDRVGDRGEES